MAARKLSAALLLVVLCTAFSNTKAQSDEAAAIIQTTILAFRMTGNAAANFSTQSQTKFSDQLRALLQEFNFMSIAVSDFTTGNGYVDVSVRAVDATDATNLTSTWATIANRAMVTNTLMGTFNALLGNQGVQGNATLVSVIGSNSPAGVNVTFEVNMTVGGSNSLQPFDDGKKQEFLTPISSFLGDHGTASIISTSQNGSAVDVAMNVSLDANTMPQFWFFITNQSALQSSLPTLGGSSLTTTVDSYNATGSVAITAVSPAPANAVPATSQSPGGASAPVTAAEASGSSQVPPVSSSASGTVTMNIGMTLYGSSVQPFTSEVQFNTASAMAGVFWIIIGTGSVQIISFTSTTATSEPASTAKAATQQYGRRLLQTGTNTTSNGTIPAENVVFAVTLPSASQNSLLVLQSSSPTVRQQFSGWFVTQMQARGYTVDADVTSVSLSAVTTQAPSQSPATSSASTSGGSGTNTGAIVGGVVGGVCGLGLIALLFLWVYHRQQRHKDLLAKEAALSRDSPETIKSGYDWDPKMSYNTMYTKDGDDFKQTIISTLSNSNSFFSSTPLYRSPLYSRITELDSAHQDDVKRLLHKRKQKESAPLTETSEHQAAALLSALSSLDAGSLYYDKYIVDKGQRKGINSIIAYARIKADTTQQVVIKFMPDHGLYKREKLFYENRQALEGDTASTFIPIMHDAYDGTPVIDTSEDEPIPPSLVLERGSFTLADWLSGKAVTSPESRPEEVDREKTLYNLCKAIEFLHARSLVHGNLSPEALMWFAELKKWKLIGFGNWARSKEILRVNYELRYAAPELLLADLAGMQQLAAAEATDMWALGCIAFELLSGHEIFGDQYSEEEIMSMLIGFVKLPWEENPEFFQTHLPSVAARNFVEDLLQRAPDARKPIGTVLHSTLFTGEAPLATQGAPTQDLHTPTNLFSTNSEWMM